MTTSLHTGARTATVSSGWTAWDVPFRLVVTDPWAMHRARILAGEYIAAVAAATPRRRTTSPEQLLADVLVADRAADTLRPFPYGITGAEPGCGVHRPALPAWQQSFESAARARTGWQLRQCPSARAVIAQRCAELVAEACSCGVLVAFGDDVATSGLAPVGGWRIEQHATGAAGEHTVVAIDGGAISALDCVRAHRGGGLQPIQVPETGRTILPVWRSVTVAAASAPAAATACAGALLRGAAAPDWLAGIGLPALLVDATGEPHRTGHWPAS